MGKLENSNKQKIRNTKIQKSILIALKLAGGLTVATLAPNALQIFRSTGNSKNSGDKRQTIYLARKRLLKKGYIRQNGNFLELTWHSDFTTLCAGKRICLSQETAKKFFTTPADLLFTITCI